VLVLAFIEGIAFDPFFRGFLAVLVGVVVLCGSVYLLLATNSGPRTGFLIAATGLFAWMSLMGVFWTARGTGWHGPDPVWAEVEINIDRLDRAATTEVWPLHGVDIAAGVPPEVTDPDERNIVASEYARQIAGELAGWRLLVPGHPRRGEAQATADRILIQRGVFESTADYVPLEFGAFDRGGKDQLPPDAGALDQAWHRIRTTVIQPLYPTHLAVIQVQAAREQFVEPGEPPPLPQADPTAPVVSVIMERDRGGPIPQLISGRRFTPLMFTAFSLTVFVVLAVSLHNRDKREAEVRARARS
jgi:hypothetical protein